MSVEMLAPIFVRDILGHLPSMGVTAVRGESRQGFGTLPTSWLTVQLSFACTLTLAKLCMYAYSVGRTCTTYSAAMIKSKAGRQYVLVV